MHDRANRLWHVMWALCLLGCMHPWKVVSQARPNPLKGQNMFAAAPLDFQNTVTEHKAKSSLLQTAERVDLTDAQKKLMNEQFLQSLAAFALQENLAVVPVADAEQSRFVIHTHVLRIGLDCAPMMRTDVQLQTMAGNAVDEYKMDVGVFCSPLSNETLDSVLRGLAEKQAEETVKYLVYRAR
jgi:hypothetical protein